jgi:hypothetical protein
VNAYIALFIGGLLLFCAGGLTALAAVRWALIQRKRLKQFLHEAYHIDLMPEISRIEGLVDLALMESLTNISSAREYLVMALEAAQRHRDNIKKALKKYHNWS